MAKKVDMSWRRYIPKIHSEGIRFVLIAAAITFLLGVISSGLGLFGFIATLCVYLFFRDPERIAPDGKNLVIAPADGVVCQIIKTTPPPELGMGKQLMTKVAIFMSVLNVHVNRNPVSGKIKQLVYIPGKFINVALDKASEDNERQLIVIETPEKQEIVCVQIAGLVARRIYCPLKEGETVTAGERFGMIRFGSRLEVYLPDGIEPLVKEGQTTLAGETLIARLVKQAGSAPKQIAQAPVKAEKSATVKKSAKKKAKKTPAKKGK